jgi:hypothetical protein
MPEIVSVEIGVVQYRYALKNSRIRIDYRKGVHHSGGLLFCGRPTGVPPLLLSILIKIITLGIIIFIMLLLNQIFL